MMRSFVLILCRDGCFRPAPARLGPDLHHATVPFDIANDIHLDPALGVVKIPIGQISGI